VPLTRRRITALSSADGFLSLSSDDGRTRVFARAGGRLLERFSIPTYRSAVVCGCVSPEFSVVVSGTSDGALVVGLLADGSTVRVVRLTFVPARIAVTPAWGFIVVHGAEAVSGRPRGVIAVYTINGQLVRTAAFRAEVE
jgi:WD40 repeat protein